MKIAFLGGGALRLLSTVDAILNHPQALPEPHLVFMDLDVGRADTMARLVAKMPSALNTHLTAEPTDDLDCALNGADFVYCCIRVGNVLALERDKHIGAQHGFHGHDDFGPSGVMLTARTVPVILSITRRMEKLCPRSWLLIFTNPVTNLVDAVTRYSSIKSVGLCSGVYNFGWDMDHLFGIGPACPDLIFRGGGLNHLSWVCADSTYQGEPIMDFIRRSWDSLPQHPGAEKCNWKWAAPLVDLYDAMFLNNGHQHHFFYHDEMARALLDHFTDTKADQLRSRQQDTQAQQAAALARGDHIEDFWQQECLKSCAPRPFPDLGASFMAALHGQQPGELTLTTPNHGHIKGLLDGFPVEATSIIRNGRIEPLALDPVPDSLKGLCHSVAAHLRTTVDAAVQADKRMLLKAMLCEPTVRSYCRALPMFEELWTAAVAGGEITPSR